MHIKHPEKYREKRYATILERVCDYLLLGIEPRGKHATGFVAFTENGGLTLDKTDAPAQEFIKERKFLPERTRTVLLHTRFATKGEPEVWGNNHPVFSGNFFTVHNGTINNDDELFKKYKFERLAEVDSEIIPAMLDKYGLEEPEKAFGELTGGFATASVNFRVPNTTILAKGGTWPLVTLETKDILLFASTEKAIKDAWGATLGTPPTNGWEELNSGDIWIVEGSRVTKKKAAFQHKGWRSSTSRNVGAASYAYDWDEWDSEPGWSHAGNGNGQYRVDRTQTTHGTGAGARTVLDNAIRMVELRKNGKGACVIYSQRQTEKGKKYLEKYGNGKWTYCVHCKVSVSDTQVVKGTKEYGDICIDCFAVARTNRPEDEGNLDAFLAEVGMRNDDFEQLQGFSDTEVYIHNQVLYKLARQTGIKRTFLDWILHRADEDVISQSKELLALYCELSDRYFSASMDLWQQWSAESVEEQQEHIEQPDPWVVCASGTHRKSEECEACTGIEEEAASCGVQAFEDKPEGVTFYDSEGPQRCMNCRRKPTFYLGLSHAWCTRHKHKCQGTDDNGRRTCKELATHHSVEHGTRYCKAHARGLKGVIADNDYKARRALAHA